MTRKTIALLVAAVSLIAVAAYAIVPATRVGGVQITAQATTPIQSGKDGIWVDDSVVPNLRWDDTITSKYVAAISATTKGDLAVYGGGGNGWIRLGVGSNDQVLTADSAQTSGVKWAPSAGAANTLSLVYDNGSASADQTLTETGGKGNQPIFVVAGVGTGQTAGLTLSNTTAATSGNQKWSPALELLAHGYDSGAAASHPINFLFQTRPIQANPLYGEIRISNNVNNAGAFETLSIGSQDDMGDVTLRHHGDHAGFSINDHELDFYFDDTSLATYMTMTSSGIGAVGMAFNAITDLADGASTYFKLNTLSSITNAGAKLLSLQNNSTEQWYVKKDGSFRAVNAVGMKLVSPGGSGVIVTDDAVGTKIAWGTDNILLDGTTIIATPAATNVGSTNLFKISNANTMSAATAASLYISTSNLKSEFVGAFSGGTDVYADGLTMTVDTAGTTANKTVTYSADNKVAKPAATANLTTIVGVALSTATNGNQVMVATRGHVMVGCSGTIARNDLLVSDDGTAGNVKTNNSAVAGAIIGKATEPCGNTIASQVEAQLSL